MRKRVRIALAILFASILSVIVWQVFRLREPIYQGKRLGVWLEGYACSVPSGGATPRLGFTSHNLEDGNLTYWRFGPKSGNSSVGYVNTTRTITIKGVAIEFRPVAMMEPAQQRADEAMDHIGTNAVPTLLRMLEAKDSFLTSRLMSLLQRQHFIKFKPYTPAWVRNMEASIAFGRLGVKAGNAVPSLIEVYERNISLASKTYTASSLGYIGPTASPAVPALLRGTVDPDVLMRPTAVQALGRIKAQPQLVVPALIKCLHDSFAPVRANAASALGGFGAEAGPAFPALIQLRTDPDSNVRDQADDAVKQIETEAISRGNRAAIETGALRLANFFDLGLQFGWQRIAPSLRAVQA